jgi:hypothetical protein
VAVTPVEGETGCPQLYTLVKGCIDQQNYIISGTHVYTQSYLTIDSVRDIGGTQCATVLGQAVEPGDYPSAGVVSTANCPCD